MTVLQGNMVVVMMLIIILYSNQCALLEWRRIVGGHWTSWRLATRYWAATAAARNVVTVDINDGVL